MITFIAIPTAGTVKDGALTTEFLKFLASLIEAMPERTFISPMVQDYQVLKFLDKPSTWDVWGEHCRRLIERSDEVWVLQFPGWETSAGVEGEITHAEKVQKPIRFIAPSAEATSIAKYVRIN